MRIQAPATLRTDPSPLPHEQRAAEQIGPNLHPVEPPLVQLRTNARQ